MFLLFAAFFSLFLLRLYSILPRYKWPVKRAQFDTVALAVFLGSGGHTTEILKLVSSLEFTRYSPRIYIVSSGDSLSAEKARVLETSKASGSSPGNYTIVTIPRARRVHQSLLATPPTALFSLLSCIYHITLAPAFSVDTLRRAFADVLILNGPGSCVMLCMAVYLNKFWGLPSPKLVYVESFARVRSLSLSGQLLRLFVDRFIVQWPDLQAKGEYHGWLV